MRILHIHSGNLYGGVESMLAALASRDETVPEIQQEFAFSFTGRISRELAEKGATIHDLGPVRVHQPWKISAARRRVVRILRERPFDVAICHMAWPQALFGPAVKRAGVPLIHWVHNPIDKYHWLELWASTTRPDLIIANSRFVATTLTPLHWRVPAEVIYCAVPSAPASASRSVIRSRLRTPEQSVVILHAGRMQSWKGQEVLLKALAKLKGDHRWTCWIVGGPQRQSEDAYFRQLRKQAQASGLAERIHFLGQRADVRELMAAADIYCQPNTEPEPFGVSFIEALWARLPVVATRLGGALEIVQPDCGILVPPSDPIGLSRALVRLIDSESVRTRMGASGPQRAATLCDPGARKQQLHSIVSRYCKTKPAEAPGSSRIAAAPDCL